MVLKGESCMKKLYLLLIPFLILGMVACSDKTSQKVKKEDAVDKEFLDDVVYFRDNIKKAMDDMVLNDHFEDLGSLSEDEYKTEIEFLFDEYKPKEVAKKPKESDIYGVCISLWQDYLQYGKQTILGESDKAQYALDNFKDDLKKLDELIKPYQ
jgi:hypothetical protein